MKWKDEETHTLQLLWSNYSPFLHSNFNAVNRVIFKNHVHTGCPIWMGEILKSYWGFIFGGRHFFPSFLWWKNVYILIFVIIFFENFKGSLFWLIFQIFSQIQIWKVDLIIRVWKSEKKFFFYSKYQNVHIFPP